MEENKIRCLSAYLNKDTAGIDFREEMVSSDDFLDFCYRKIGYGCETVQIAEIEISGKVFTIWLDEEGKIKRYADPILALDILPKEYHDLILGNVVITGGASEEGDTLGLDEEDVSLIREYLEGKAFFCRWNGKRNPFLFLEKI